MNIKDHRFTIIYTEHVTSQRDISFEELEELLAQDGMKVEYSPTERRKENRMSYVTTGIEPSPAQGAIFANLYAAAKRVGEARQGYSNDEEVEALYGLVAELLADGDPETCNAVTSLMNG